MVELKGAKSTNVAENACGMQGHNINPALSFNSKGEATCSKCGLTLTEIREGKMETPYVNVARS